MKCDFCTTFKKGESFVSRYSIYTHDEAMTIVEMFENILCEYGIRIPNPEDDEREPDDIGLYGTTYSDLFDSVEERLIYLLNRSKCGERVISYVFSGAI